MQNDAQKLAYSIDDIAKLVGVGRSLLFEEVKAGRLPVKKAGRRTLILDADLSAWLSNLPAKTAGGPKRNKLNPETHK
jgi:excisionase family DNA binding protein